MRTTSPFRLTLRSPRIEEKPRIGDPTYPRKLLNQVYPPPPDTTDTTDTATTDLLSTVVDHWSTIKANPATLRRYVPLKFPNPESLARTQDQHLKATAGLGQPRPNDTTTLSWGSSLTTSLGVLLV